MRRTAIAFFILTASCHLAAEEVLSSRPVVIAPKRIETETTIPAKRGKKATQPERKERDTPVPVQEPLLKDNSITLDDKNILMKISFKSGSIQLSRPIRKQLVALGVKPGQKIRITGFGADGGKNATRLANLRARVIASFLTEAVGEIDANLQWSGKAQTGYEGAVIEALP